MSKSLKTVVEETAEKLGWSCRFETQRRGRYHDGKWDREVTEKYVEFRQGSPAGEDFDITVVYDRLAEVPEKVYEFYQDFDVDEHVYMWLEAKQNGVGGVPSARVLVEDAEAIEQMLLDLSEALRDAYRERGIW